jgi:acyl-CoA hydrolase
MPSITDTTAELIHWVFPEHAGAPGQIHGGRMMEWIAQAGTLAAARLARGVVALGAMDDIDFLHPVKIGEIAILRAQVEYVGRSSLEVGVRVWAENVVTGRRAVCLNAHLVFVALDDHGRPRPVSARIEAAGAEEQELVAAARERREHRLARFARRDTRAADTAASEDAEIRWKFESVRTTLPEDALFGDMMFAGKMLMQLDEAGGILSMRYCRGLVMTACLDAMDFRTPIFTHEVLTFQAGLNHVGTSSLEIGVRVLAEQPHTGEVRHACTAYLTYVHLGDGREALRPQPCRPFTPQTPAERRRWAEAVVRREHRLARVKRLKSAIQNERG